MNLPSPGPENPSRTGGKPHAAKAQLRADARLRLKTVTPEHRAHASAQLCERLRQQAIWREAQFILFYAPRPPEVDIECLVEAALASGKSAALPRFDREAGVYRACRISTALSAISPGAFGIREPGTGCPVVPMKQLDLILVPGLAFDLDGRRLGHGRGYYDRLLAEAKAVTCGIAYDEQVRLAIPVESHDILLDCIVTPTRWVGCRQRRLGDDCVG
jgi:5-formyltetrahydrofolate cyclo-ligase